MVLPDVLREGLKIVFCGTAVGNRSAKRRCYYAGPGNQFWPTLKKLNLIPKDFDLEEFDQLPAYGIGLTDLVKVRSGQDAILKTKDFDIAALRMKIEKFLPAILAFNGKRAAEAFLGHPVEYGPQKERIGNTLVFVLPSTSGAARGYWDENQWIKLAKLVCKAAR